MEMPSFLQSKQTPNSNPGWSPQKRKLWSIIGLLVLLLVIPLTVWLAQRSQVFSPKASGGPIELVMGDGSCVLSTNPNKVNCATFPIRLTSSLESTATSSASPSPTPSGSPTAAVLDRIVTPDGAFKYLTGVFGSPVDIPFPKIPEVNAQNAEAILTANPNPCVIGANQLCTTTISWNAGNRSNVQISIKEVPGSLFASGPSGSQAAPWISAPGVTFELYSGTTLLKSLFVKGVTSATTGLITGNPNPCTIVSNNLCTSSISWMAANKTDVKITIREVPGSLFATGPSGVQAAPWIATSGATFDLYSGSTLLDSTFVKGISQNASATPSASVTPTGPGVTKEYKVAETEAGLANAQVVPYPGPVIADFSFSDSNPGVKQIWVEFIGFDGSSKKEHVTVEMVEPDPVITSLDCSMDVSKQDLRVTLAGSRFGVGSGKVKVNENEAQIQSWQNDQVTATIKPEGNLEDGKLFKVQLTRSDGEILEPVTCMVNTTLISLGARLFCREPGKFDVSDVQIVLVDENGNRVNETVTIDKDGLIKNLKTKLQVGKLYAISIKAPYSIRRNSLFVAANGTNVVSNGDNPFLLPVGDIAPVIASDGKINTLDRAELVRQWSILAASTKTGDFNKDTKVNSIDWACMRFDFNSEDEAIPARAAYPSASPSVTPSPLSTPGPSSSASVSPSSSPRAGTAYFLLEPVGGGSYTKNAEFAVNIKLWSQDEAANLFVSKLTFEPTYLEVVRIEKGGAVPNWTEEFYDNQTGEISLAAGLPNPGLQTTEGNDPLMAKIIFKAKNNIAATTINMIQGSRIFSNQDNADILSTLASVQVAIPVSN